ncbi:MAG TPA: zf-HC2 domain-containing protein [Candidatus Acidoferrales bacterium]|nr:zf-HC2 domain-containing protein [Candidatus Acidoferrales bacterium]
MPCEKYSAGLKNWMADAALGALSPEREADLRAHIEECAACREAFDEARATFSAIDRGIESLVNGAPSAQFEVRLRARLAAEPAPRRFWQLWPAWVPATAGAFAVAGLLLVALLWHSPRPASRNTTPPVANRVQPNHATPPAPEPALALNPPASLTPVPPPRHEHAGSPARRVAQRAPAHPAEPEVLVEPGQFAAIVQYSEALASGAIKGDQVIAAGRAMEKPLEIKLLEIKPAAIAPLDDSDAKTSTLPSENSNRP